MELAVVGSGAAVVSVRDTDGTAVVFVVTEGLVVSADVSGTSGGLEVADVGVVLSVTGMAADQEVLSVEVVET